MKKIFYITRTIPGEGTGGALIRQGTVRYLREAGYKVVVIALSDKTDVGENQILIKGPVTRYSVTTNMILFNLGLYDDYLHTWANKAFKLLKGFISKDDVLLATSGGELGTLMLSKKLKDSIGCRIVYNLHDPISFTLIDGEFSYMGRYKMRARDNAESVLFQAADAIVTSSQYYADALKRKYPKLAPLISCHHFGYIEKFTIPEHFCQNQKKINIVYGGNMGRLQGPEILLKLADLFPDIDFTFVGNFVYPKDIISSNVHIKPKMPYKEYISYISKSADIGFFSLVGNVSKLCVPSKLYEYINVGIPILAAIDGDSRKIINENGYGIATDYSVYSLGVALSTLIQSENLYKARQMVLKERDKWYMKTTISELIKVL